VPFAQIVRPLDEEKFIRIPFHEPDAVPTLFGHSLSDLGLDVATGPVVDFRLRDHWLTNPIGDFVPLLYAHHFSKNEFQWPREHRKPNALVFNSTTSKWLMPRGWYALTKRFSSKEERRRVVAYVVDPDRLPGSLYGFENHLNVIHSQKQGLGEALARGIALFLNSTLVDKHFRTFSGHTQVNATDLRAMRFPDMETLLHFGDWAKRMNAVTQDQIDQFVESHNGS
jgi:adenine-specific DNA-methyltransferase